MQRGKRSDPRTSPFKTIVRNQDNPETNPDAAGGNLTLVTVGGAAKAGVEVPGAAAEHAGVALAAFGSAFGLCR